MADAADRKLSDEELQDLVASSDSGARQPDNRLAAALLIGVAFLWSLFQLWYASPLPFITGILAVNDAQARAIHLGFAVFLAFLAYPALQRDDSRPSPVTLVLALVAPLLLLWTVLDRGLGANAAANLAITGGATVLILAGLYTSNRHRISIPDWALALIGVFCATYLWWAYDALAERPGRPIALDIVVALGGLILLLEATRRALGPPLVIVAVVFLLYVFFGNAAWVPDVIKYQGASLNRAMDQFWLSTQGVFGVAIGVSTKFVFLFVLFGALLEKAGAGNYFIKVAFSLLGHLRGGPAKAAVVASGMTGLISGSSIANVVTTGTFTVPLMRRVGFSAEKAGSVEVASSVNGQIMPPVMGAAAFLMVEYVGIPYIDVIRHAFLPAVISYIALIYIVHLEALKSGMQGLEKPRVAPWYMTLVTAGIVIASIIILSFVTYYALGWIKPVFGDNAGWVIAGLVTVVYVGLLWHACRYPELKMDDPNDPVLTLPETGPTVNAGLHFLLPIVVLVWCLMVERLSPGLSAFWATTLMIVILLTQRPLIALFRQTGQGVGTAARQGAMELFDGMVTGARNMIGIGIATATAGIIVGTVGLTGIGLVMSAFVEFLSGGNLVLMLLLVAVLSLILGMGLPTTANYIVVSALMAPVIVEVGAANGLIVPLIAVHLFVFYFGIMADVTPPVGLASFAAAAVSGGDPLKTGFTAFFYSLRTAALPFLFIFNTQLILYDLQGITDLVMTVVTAVIAMLVFAAATQGYFFARSKVWETVALLLIAFTLFRPGFWMDQVVPPLQAVPPAQIATLAADLPEGGILRVSVERESYLDGSIVSQTLALEMPAPAADGEARLADIGMEFLSVDGDLVTAEAGFGSALDDLDLDPLLTITAVEIPADQPPKELMWIPAFLLLGAIIFLQRRRTDVPAF